MPTLVSSAGQDAFQLGRVQLGPERFIVVRYRDRLGRLSELLEAPSSTLALLEDWDRWVDAIDAALANWDRVPPLAEADLEWLAPLDRTGKLICIGANYRDHIAEMNGNPDDYRNPYSFSVPPGNTLVGDGATVAFPAGPVKFDWESELAIVIGQRAKHVKAAQALDQIGAYSVLNDLGARDFALPHAPPVGIDWIMSKAYDGFKPMGRYLTPARFVPRPGELRVRSWVNGVAKQDGNTRDMLFDIGAIVEHLSAIMTLEPGDVIATGTPAGCGHGRRPPEYLAAGDTVAVEVEGLGRVTTTFA